MKKISFLSAYTLSILMTSNFAFARPYVCAQLPVEIENEIAEGDGIFYEGCFCERLNGTVTCTPANDTPIPLPTSTKPVFITPLSEATNTPESTATVEFTKTPQSTETPENTSTPIPTATSTQTPENTETPTPTSTSTETPTPQSTATSEVTLTPTPTSTPTATPTMTMTFTPVVTATIVASSSPTPQPTITTSDDKEKGEFGSNDSTIDIFVKSPCTASDKYRELFNLTQITKGYFQRLGQIRVNQLQSLRLKNERAKNAKRSLSTGFVARNKLYQDTVTEALLTLGKLPPVFISCPQPAPSQCTQVSYPISEFRSQIQLAETELQRSYKFAIKSPAMKKILATFWKKNKTSQDTPAIAKKTMKELQKYSLVIPETGYVCVNK